ncbi:uncharacterized protein GGS25DRAFT_257032 [Hypoxylon fragiforme]|uniref:uncharacterized protein n=1 Tax=Hypoxylon fragiforme TaxID=63214 RepID=UPI0020C5CB02|nr:uncharacterized protein GGS25DRAFT_257032 [Hypoxylon fragiforme]KAI2610348.1 hypothetical protein GGS25DRAFT_257032 [Hypoxylon fragiforme]
MEYPHPNSPSSESDDKECVAPGPKLTPEHLTTPEDTYAFLRHFDTVFLIDDSEGMFEYWPEIAALLQSIVSICNEHDSDGIDVFFVNHRPPGHRLSGFLGSEDDRSGYRHIRKASGSIEMRDNVAGIFARVVPRGSCRLGRRLGYILNSYMRDYEMGLQTSIDGPTGQRHYLKPLNLIVITAGFSEDNPKEALIQTARRLDELHAPAYQVSVQMFRVNDDESPRLAMGFSYDTQTEALDMRDKAPPVTWSGLEGELTLETILKTVLFSVKSCIDKQD